MLIVVGSLLIIVVVLGVLGALKDMSQLRLAALVLLFILFAILGKCDWVQGRKSNFFNAWFCFQAAVGVWGMICFKTGRLQRSIDADIKNFNEIKTTDAEYPTLKKKIDYLNQVRELISPSDKNPFSFVRNTIAVVLIRHTILEQTI